MTKGLPLRMADAIADIAAGNAADTLRALSAERLEVRALQERVASAADEIAAQAAALRAAAAREAALLEILDLLASVVDWHEGGAEGAPPVEYEDFVARLRAAVRPAIGGAEPAP